MFSLVFRFADGLVLKGPFLHEFCWITSTLKWLKAACRMTSPPCAAFSLFTPSPVSCSSIDQVMFFFFLNWNDCISLSDGLLANNSLCFPIHSLGNK